MRRLPVRPDAESTLGTSLPCLRPRADGVGLQITNANTLTCAGCQGEVTLWSPTITLSGAGSVPPIVLAMPPAHQESCGGWNGGNNCEWPDAIEATTWGRVKSMYR